MLSFIPESIRKPAIIAAIILAAVLFIKFTPFLTDFKVGISSWVNERARASLEKDIAKMQTKIDSVNNTISGYQKKNDSLAWEIKALDGRIYARIKSIDSLRGVVSALEKARIDQGNKEKVNDKKIADVNYFVDSLFHYRDSIAAHR